MKFSFKQVLMIMATLLLLLPVSANAQPKGPKVRKEARKEARKDRKEARKDRKEARKAGTPEERKEARKAGSPEERKEARKEQKEVRKEAREESKEARIVIRDARKARREKIRHTYSAWRHRFQLRVVAIGDKVKFRRSKRMATRQLRRKTQREEMGARLGKIKGHKEARRAVQVHAWRAARLEGVEDFARAAGNDKEIERIVALKKKNDEQLEKRLAKLEEAPGAADEPAPDPAPAASPTKEEGGKK